MGKMFATSGDPFKNKGVRTCVRGGRKVIVKLGVMSKGSGFGSRVGQGKKKITTSQGRGAHNLDRSPTEGRE